MQVRLEFQHFVRRGNEILAATADHMRQIMPQAEPQQLVAHELACGQSTALFVIQLPRPGHELEGDHIGIGVLVGGALGQHMPDDDQELAGDGDDGLVLVHAAGGRHNRSKLAVQKSFVSTACQAASTSTYRNSLRPSLVM